MRALQNYSEKQILETIDKVVKRIATKFTFGYFDIDDIEQEGRILAMSALEDYDEVRPLENYLAVFVKNRLINLKRDKFFRHQKPCYNCPLLNKGCRDEDKNCTKFEDKMLCDLYKGWFDVNNAKKNLVEPIDIYSVDDEKETNTKLFTNIDDDIDFNMLKQYIDGRLPSNMRADYLKMLSNYGARKVNQAKVAFNRQQEVRQTVAAIIEEYREQR